VPAGHHRRHAEGKKDLVGLTLVGAISVKCLVTASSRPRTSNNAAAVKAAAKQFSIMSQRQGTAKSCQQGMTLSR
jgi:hypothetical protein